MKRLAKSGLIQAIQALPNITTKSFLGTLAFTLVEILMVILVLGILVAIAVPQFVDFSNDARTAVSRDRLNQIKLSIIGDSSLKAHGRLVRPGFEFNIGVIPTALSELATVGLLATYSAFTKMGWNGPYVVISDADWSKDGWGTTFSYGAAGRAIKSCGPNTTCGNADDVSITF